MQRHRHQEFIRFLNGVEAAVPTAKAIHAVVDNYATHKHSKTRAWLARHPRWTFHFTPTSCSWLNAVEGFFAKLAKRRLKRGVFRSLADLQAAINSFLDEHNTQALPLDRRSRHHHRRCQTRAPSVGFDPLAWKRFSASSARSRYPVIGRLPTAHVGCPPFGFGCSARRMSRFRSNSPMARLMLDAGLLRPNRPEISVPLSPSGAPRRAVKILSAIGSPRASPKMNAADRCREKLLRLRVDLPACRLKCRLEPPLQPIGREIDDLLRVLAIFGDDLVAIQQYQHGHADEAETLAIGLVGVVIELHDAQVGVLGHPAFDHGSDLVAGCTPGCPVVAELQLGTRR
jgi:transposase